MDRDETQAATVAESATMDDISAVVILEPDRTLKNPQINKESLESAPASAPSPVMAQLTRDTIETIVQATITRMSEVTVSRRRTCSLTEAVERHGHTRQMIQATVENPANRIRHSWIPGRGRTGRELSIVIADLDAYYGLA